MDGGGRGCGLFSFSIVSCFFQANLGKPQKKVHPLVAGPLRPGH